MTCRLCGQPVSSGEDTSYCRRCEPLPHYEKLLLTRLLAIEGQLDAMNNTMARALDLMDLGEENERRRYASLTTYAGPHPKSAG